jgi:PKD repeat protein
VPVTFTTTRGTITPALANTDADGVARSVLTGSETATVTARVGAGSGGTTGGGTTPPPAGSTGGTTATIEVRTASTPSFSLTTAPTSPSAGQPVILTITPGTAAAGGGTGTTPTNLAPTVRVNWGDGDNDDIGVVAAVRSVTHTYDAPGFYTITATGTQEGEEFTNATAVTVSSPPPVELNVNPTSGNTSTTFTFTITPTPGALIRNVRINYGDNTGDDFGALSTQRTVTHVYSTSGTKTVTVTQEETNNRVTTATATVLVTGS